MTTDNPAPANNTGTPALRLAQKTDEAIAADPDASPHDDMEFEGVPSLRKMMDDQRGWNPLNALKGKNLSPKERAYAEDMIRSGGGQSKDVYESEVRWQMAEQRRNYQKINDLTKERDRISGYDREGEPQFILSEPRRQYIQEQINKAQYENSALEGERGVEQLEAALLKANRIKRRLLIERHIKEQAGREEAEEAIRDRIEERKKTLRSMNRPQRRR